MAYGRLDVLWGDGNFRSFPLAESVESVGRSTGNTIVLEAETISRYHFSISHKDGVVKLADVGSQNGTYVDGQKLTEGDSVELHGGEEIIIGQLRIIYYAMDEMATQPIQPEDDTTQVFQGENAKFLLSLQPPPIAFPPGAHASAELSISNTGTERAFYKVEVSGVPKNWVRLDRPRLMVEGGESAQVIINVRPTRIPESTPGYYTLTVAVQDETTPQIIAQATTRIHVLAYTGFGMALEHHTLIHGDRFRLHLHNQGNDNLTLTISNSDKTPDVELELISSSQVTIPPGQRLVIQGTLKAAKPNWLGKTQTHPFHLMVRSHDKSGFLAVTEGKLIQPALLPSWSPYAAVGVLLALIFGVLTLFGVLFAPQPQIVNLEVASSNVARGDNVTLSWQTRNARALMLHVDGTPVSELTPAESGSILLNTQNYAQSTLLELVASNRGKVATLQQRLLVYEPIRLIAFNVNPPRLVQNVVQNLDLNWELANADYVMISGLEAFTSTDYSGVRFDAVDSIEGIAGLAERSLTLSIYAQDALGNEFTYQTVIEAEPAQCTPAADNDIVLRDGPNRLNQQVATVPAQTSVVVDGLDFSREWVRVQLDGGVSGWGLLAEFSCANTFDPNALRQILEVKPPPQPTATPTLTPSPTPVPSATPTQTPVPTLVPQTNNGSAAQRSAPMTPTLEPTDAG